MASTNAKQIDALTQFHRKRIMRLALIPEMDWLCHGEPDSDDTYFVSRENQRMRPEDFEFKLGDELSAGETLDRAWSSTPLRGLGRDMIKLVRYFPPAKQEAAISSFIYEMF